MAHRTIWWDGDDVVVIDQTRLPWELTTVRWRTLHDAVAGIASMQVRGAPLIGVAAAHGLALALRARPGDLDTAVAQLAGARPTAVNLRWALERVRTAVAGLPPGDRAAEARRLSDELAGEDVAACRAIGETGLEVVAQFHAATRRPVQIMTHCNAGWLACIEWGTATAPVYLAHEKGLPVHVWVSETRPRNQGAALTAWELGHRGVPHTVVVDNAAGHLLQTGRIDFVVVGADRIAANGDVANKIGTYLKAVAARDCGVPFHVAAPRSTFDPGAPDGTSIPIEERSPDEVLTFAGSRIAPEGSPARNWAFDVTPARLVDRYLTDHGALSRDDLSAVLDR